MAVTAADQTGDDSGLVPFTDLHMVGGRFETPGLPIDVISDVRRYTAMVVEVAKEIWRTRNRGRTRLPAGFVENLDLRLTKVNPGSVVPVIERRNAELDLDLPSVVDEAKEHVDRAFAAIVDGNFDAVELPPSARQALSRFGSSLRPGEQFVFRASSSEPIQYDRATRRRFLARGGETVAELGLVLGTIRALDTTDKSFKLVLPGEINPIVGRFSDLAMYEVLHTLHRSENDALVRLDCACRVTTDGVVVGIDDVFAAEPLVLPDQPCGKRLIELAALTKGWLDGADEGEAIGLTALEAAGESLQWVQDEGLVLPRVYPTADGKVQLEWHETADHVEAVVGEDLSFEVFVVSASGDERTNEGRGMAQFKEALAEALRSGA